MSRAAPLLALVAGLAAACVRGAAADPVPPPTAEVAVASGEAGGYAVRLLAAGPLQVGLNTLALEVRTAAGEPVPDATVELLPLFTAGAVRHRCPVMGPSGAGAGWPYALRAVFQVPSGAGSWSAEVAVTRAGTTVTVPLSALTVAAGKDLARAFPSTAGGYVLALEFLAPVAVGLNPVAVTLHETGDGGMTFAPVTDATLALDPQMPSMGHGSPGSVDPTLVEPGGYEGRLSLSMTGAWEITVTARRAGAVVGAPLFSVSF